MVIFYDKYLIALYIFRFINVSWISVLVKYTLLGVLILVS